MEYVKPSVEIKKEKDNDIDFIELLLFILNKLWIVLIVAFVFGAAAWAYYEYTYVPKYSSDGMMIIMYKKDYTQITQGELGIAESLTSDYYYIMTSRTVLNQVIDECELTDSVDVLKSRISIYNPDNTRILRIYITHEDADKAQQIVTSLINISSRVIKEKTNAENIEIIDEAREGSLVYVSNRTRIVVAGAIGAAIVIFILVFIVILDDNIKSPQDIERYLGLSVLAVIPEFETTSSASGRKRRKRTTPVSVEKRTTTNTEVKR